jgi:hypothetical protein
MNIPFSGGCACGSVRYTVAREPIAMVNCHCSDCQLSSGLRLRQASLSRPPILRSSVHRRHMPFMQAAEVFRPAGFALTAARLCSRKATLTHKSLPSDFRRLTISPASSRCWIYIPPVRKSGFALIRPSHTSPSRPRHLLRVHSRRRSRRCVDGTATVAWTNGIPRERHRGGSANPALGLVTGTLDEIACLPTSAATRAEVCVSFCASHWLE